MNQMKNILQNLGLERSAPAFEAEKVSPDIVCKLSWYEMNSLGVVNRSDVMNLRRVCLNYGSYQPRKAPSTGIGPLEFLISKATLETLIETGFLIKEIAKLLSVSESTVYRRMRAFGLTKANFTDIEDEQLIAVVQEVINDFPNSGETMLNQILKQRNIKVLICHTVMEALAQGIYTPKR